MSEKSERELGALAQAVRNFIISRGEEDLATLDRLSATSLKANRLLPYAQYHCPDCGEVPTPDGTCECNR